MKLLSDGYIKAVAYLRNQEIFIPSKSSFSLNGNLTMVLYGFSRGKVQPNEMFQLHQLFIINLKSPPMERRDLIGEKNITSWKLSSLINVKKKTTTKIFTTSVARR